MAIIAMAGYIGSGKDTCANYLVEKHGYIKMAFADSLKDVVSVAFDMDRKMLEGDTKESRDARAVVDVEWSEITGIPDFTPRKALQFTGTDLFKKRVASNFWIEHLRRKIEKSSNKNIIITDCRYHDEFDFAKSIGATAMFIRRGELPKYHKWSSRSSLLGKTIRPLAMKLFYPNIHSSEWHWNNVGFDYIIDNSGSLAQTYEQLDAFTRRGKWKH